MTETYAVTVAPADLVAALSLAPGNSYICEVVAGNAAVRLFEGGATAPTDLSYYHVILPAGRLGVKPAAGSPVWVWAPSPSRLVVSKV